MKYIKSPLNYTGGKYKLLKDIVPYFPDKCENFVDLFSGGLNVGINVNAKNLYVNDHNSFLTEFYEFLKNTETNRIVSLVKETIEQYSLSQSNTDGYNRLRCDYNEQKSPLLLFVLTCYAFNHQIRFNNSFEFNTPFGKERSSYNSRIEENLIRFTSALKEKNIFFSSVDFRRFPFSSLNQSDFVYCDPPYLISTASYNDGKRGFGDWKEKDDLDLLAILDNLHSRNIYFALSNVFVHKGAENKALIEWSNKYKVIFLDKKYSNCSYHFKNRQTSTIEVLVTNYMGKNK